MKADDEKLDRLIEQLTSGETVDWVTELARYQKGGGKDIEYIEQLKTLEQIYTVLNFGTTTTQDNEGTSKQKHQFIWGHLEVIESIGVGNFGEVYRAFDPLLNRDVALKLLKVEQMSVVKSRGFISEARSLAKVRNRHVLAIHGANMHDGRVGFWADLLPGDTLADSVVDFASEDQLLKVTAAVTDALSAVHQAGLIHGDVKLSNVMSEVDGKITLMDFGAGGEIDMAAPTTGSPILMAPELFNEQPKTAASDIYALGVMLFKLATDQYPIKADNVLEVVQAHKKQQYLSLSVLRPDLRKSVREMINQMLFVDQMDRPDTTKIKARLDGIKAAPQKRKKRMVVVGLFSVLLIATLVSSLGLYQANQARQTAEKEQQKATAVSEFMVNVLKTNRPNVSGKNTPVVEILESAVNQLKSNLLDQPLARAELLHHIGVNYIRMIAPNEAINLLEEAHALRIENLGEMHPKTLSTQAFLGSALVRLSRFEEAKSLLLIGDEIVDQLPLENNLRLTFTSALVFYYNFTGEVELSEHHSQKMKTMVDFETDPLKYHEVQLQTIRELNNQQKFDVAESIAQESLMWAETNMPRSGLTMGLRQQLSNIMGHTGRFEESERLANINIDLATEWLGPEDPYLIRSLALMSSLLWEQERFEDGLKVNSNALELSERVNGADDWYTIRLLGEQGDYLKALNQPEAAERVLLESIVRADRALSPKHAFSYLSRKGLAEIYLEQGDYDAGIEMSKSTISIIEEVRGSKNRWLLEARHVYAELLLAKGDLVRAEKELGDVLLTIMEVSGKDDSLALSIIETMKRLPESN